MTETNRQPLTCGHTVARKDHRWVTAKGNSACRPDCVDRLERRGG